jgi:leucyl aminopeptidase
VLNVLIEISQGSLTATLCDTLLIFATSESTTPSGIAGEVDKLLNDQISKLLVEQPKIGKYGELTVIHTLGIIPAKRIIIAGLGIIKEMNIDRLRALLGSSIRVARKHGSKMIATYTPDLLTENPAVVVPALVEGVILGSYLFEEYKTTKQSEEKIEKLILTAPAGSDAGEIKQLTEQAKIIADSVNFARDLVNHPANTMTPVKLAWHAVDVARQYGLEVNILNKQEIEALHMQAFLAVTQGTSELPQLIVLKYLGAPETSQFIGFIGKGITFDSGGISLKPSEGMDEMKTDMAGGAAVLGAMRAISQIKPKVNILAIVPCAENMPSGNALKPGDVISSMGGKTIEVVNTDAEGRLLLADAVAYAKQLGVQKLVDLATLTGACVVALGSVTSGVISNNDEWCERLLDAAKKAGEKMWRLPADAEYKEQIKSPIADLKNSGGRQAGAITAGLFIAEFAGDTPWIHIDIAGTATTSKDIGYNVKGATGIGVRTLIRLAQDMTSV